MVHPMYTHRGTPYVYPPWYTLGYQHPWYTLGYQHPWYTLYIPTVVHPVYTHRGTPPGIHLSLGTPPGIHPLRVHLGTPTPVFSDPVGDSLGSTLRLITEIRRIEASQSPKV